uniref:Uncharacterized protein n=1 Tax=Cannabis sativa TaxID=3483 RepID=A0A803R5M0_CANSA
MGSKHLSFYIYEIQLSGSSFRSLLRASHGQYLVVSSCLLTPCLLVNDVLLYFLCSSLVDSNLKINIFNQGLFFFFFVLHKYEQKSYKQDMCILNISINI